MSRFRRSSGSSGGGGGGTNFQMMGYLGVVFGAVVMIAELIIYGIAIQQLDSSITAAGGFSGSMPGLSSIMGIFGMVLFLLFMGIGIASLAMGGYGGFKTGSRGDWMGVLVASMMGGVTILITLIVFGLIITQLQSAMVTVNATAAPTTRFPGLVNIMGIWGMVVFLSLMGSAMASLVGAGVGAYKKIKG